MAPRELELGLFHSEVRRVNFLFDSDICLE